MFSGAAIVTWFLENIDGVNSVEDAEQLGQILLDKGAIFHSDGSRYTNKMHTGYSLIE